MEEISSFLFKDSRVMDILDYSCLDLENKFRTLICIWVSLQFPSKWNMEVMSWRSAQEELITSPYFTSASLISSILHFILNLWKFSSSLGLRQNTFAFLKLLVCQPPSSLGLGYIYRIYIHTYVHRESTNAHICVHVCTHACEYVWVGAHMRACTLWKDVLSSWE